MALTVLSSYTLNPPRGAEIGVEIQEGEIMPVEIPVPERTPAPAPVPDREYEEVEADASDYNR